MHKISIVGSPGAGKTTFSRVLGQALGIEVFELDRMFGHLDKIRIPRPEREARLAGVLARPSYILDGGFSWTYPQRIAACDTLIWMELGMGRHFVNVLRRSWSANGQGAAPAARPRRFRDRFPTMPFWAGFFYEHGIGITPVRSAFASPPDRVKLVQLQSLDAAQAFLDGLNPKGVVPMADHSRHQQKRPAL